MLKVGTHYSLPTKYSVHAPRVAAPSAAASPREQWAGSRLVRVRVRVTGKGLGWIGIGVELVLGRQRAIGPHLTTHR